MNLRYALIRWLAGEDSVVINVTLGRGHLITHGPSLIHNLKTLPLDTQAPLAGCDNKAGLTIPK